MHGFVLAKTDINKINHAVNLYNGTYYGVGYETTWLKRSLLNE